MKVSRPDGITRKAQMACAEWLSSCLKLGWRKDQLDDLENLWWRHHDRLGEMRPAETGEKERDERAS